MRIRTERIALGALLKWAGVVHTGGEAKTLIAARRILVNGQVEERRGRQVTAGDVVAVQGGPRLVVARTNDATSSPALAPRLS
ncbi:MAG: RNA-binding S4 domain-containing protein [Armatimonadota bacterium]